MASSKEFGCQLPGALHCGLKAAAPSKNPAKKRRDALLERSYFWKQIQREKKLEELLEKYDRSKTGSLNKEELGWLLEDAAQGRRPTEEEVNFVLWTTHRENKNAGDSITKSEIATALDVWKSWESVQPEVEELMKKYDINHSGKLECAQLKALLTDLNDNHPPEDAEVTWVMKAADGALRGVEPSGGINPTELKGAISLWMTHLDEGKSHCTIC
mmetsp:Transcript_38206/g.78348  ORF Transcript_38206/g.78348 Transcript_38206/m.78348 type:complete len:215 (-) Transcript_38206:474-1118(-)|eukprot:CAMPEP_0181340296 /NCGR_PEP_ID=MMETSP1101-20121128/29760_1 /TAXON_ID=46948 /ORGANISM="Rhodomonas abbreviata, Strain Caron Lab Isolate" /LENGTH=214 /DNA_ID=CAMNT_0023451415 /DNA_START=96 /DNA_END=740 /DNA_ORIENTATION=+